MNPFKELTHFLNENQIKTDSLALEKYGKDWTTYFNPNPAAILFPITVEEVQKIVLWANSHKIKLIPSGGRTGLSGGSVAIQNEVVVSLEKLNKILEFNSLEHTVTCQAGVITEELQKFAKDNNLFFPIDFASRGSSQIGGNIATNAGGIKVVRYGLIRDYVLGLKVVTGSGQILNLNQGLIKNATGYDLRHLFIGSEGTLGFIVEATLELIPSPKNSSVLFLAVPEQTSIINIFSEFKNKSILNAFELISDNALTHVLHAGYKKPFETTTPFYLLVEIENSSNQNSSDDSINDLFESLFEKNFISDGVISQSQQQHQDLWKLRENISEAISPHSPYKNDLSVRISHATEFMASLNEILKQKYPNFEVLWYGHIGDGNLHINILKPKQLTKDLFLKECQTVDKVVFETVQKFNGSISAEHGVGLTKKPYLSYSRSIEEIRLLKEIKRIFDPNNTLNPSKIFDQ